jgi:2'-5' RNA ligase
MSKPPIPMAYRGGGSIRFPRRHWMTQDDTLLLNSLPTELAKRMEPLLHQQARSDERFHQHVTLASDLQIAA